MNTILTVNQLTKKYSNKTALSDISFSIKAGEAIGLVGPNGAGKSTLLKMICGATHPTSGNITISKTNTAGKTLGFVLSPSGIPHSMSAQEFLKIETLSQHLPKFAIHDAIESFKLNSFSKQPFGKLSTGQRQRVALAAATLANPQILLLDEPTNGLDIEAIHWLRTLIENRTNKKLTTIISSHNLLELDRMTSRTLVLKTKLLFDGQNFEGENQYFSLVGKPTGANLE